MQHWSGFTPISMDHMIHWLKPPGHRGVNTLIDFSEWRNEVIWACLLLQDHKHRVAYRVLVRSTWGGLCRRERSSRRHLWAVTTVFTLVILWSKPLDFCPRVQAGFKPGRFPAALLTRAVAGLVDMQISFTLNEQTNALTPKIENMLFSQTGFPWQLHVCS